MKLSVDRLVDLMTTHAQLLAINSCIKVRRCSSQQTFVLSINGTRYSRACGRFLTVFITGPSTMFSRTISISIER